MPDFLPRPEADLLQWARNFDQKISISYADYGLTLQQAQAFGQANALFAAQYRRAKDPSTRTTPAIAGKNDSRDAMKKLARELAGLVRAKGASDQQRIELGLRVVKKTRTRIGAPATAPTVSVLDVRGSRVRIRLFDPLSPTRIAKPKGVDRALLFICASEQPPARAEQWSLLKQMTRTRERVLIHGKLAPGARVWIAAQWDSPTGRRGPMGAAVSTHIQYHDALPEMRLKAA